MTKSPSKEKMKNIKQGISTNFMAAWDESWMDLSDLSEDQINEIYLTLTTIDIFHNMIYRARHAHEAGAIKVFLKWFFSALAPKLSMKEAVNILSPSMADLAHISIYNEIVAAICHKGLSSLIRRHPKDISFLIKALRERFNVQYYSNGTPAAYNTPFEYFMGATSPTHSLLLIALAKNYNEYHINQGEINNLLWEKGFNLIPKSELFRFIQVSRMKGYMPLPLLRRMLCSIDFPFPRSDRLSGPLRHLLDEINYTLAEEHLPGLINKLMSAKPSMSMRLFSSKVAQVFHKHWRAGDQIYTYREIEHLVMLYISRHQENGKFNNLFGMNRLGKLMSHIPDFHRYMEFIAEKDDISLGDNRSTNFSDTLSSSDMNDSAAATTEASSSESSLRMQA